MKCNVPSCTSDSSKPAKCLGITFHSFPKDPTSCKAWVEALGTTNWTPKTKSFICSEHFKEEDFYETQDGNRKLYGAALPITIQDLDAPAALRVCRICLVLDAKMYDISGYNLMFEQVTGDSACAGDAARMPQRMCWECASRLTAAADFRTKALLTSKLLRDIMKMDDFIKIRDIRSINRTRYKLKSNLVQKVFDSEFFVKIQGDEEQEMDVLKLDNIKTEEIPILYQNDENLENEDKTNIFVEIKEQSRTDTNDSDEENMSDDVSFNFTDNSSESETEKDIEPKPDEIESKVESTDDESDLELIEIYKHVFRDVNNENEGKNEVSKSKKSPSKRVRTKEPSDSSSKRQAQSTTFGHSIDKTLFTITPLTYEQEMQNRQERSTYKNASYKCTHCYTGFQNKDAFNRHVLKHTEQAGAYECTICKVRCKTNYILRRHMFQHNKKYDCKQCEFVTTHSTAASEHSKFHAGKRYQCSKCSSMFEKRSSYLSHLRLIHTHDFVCELCGYTFVSKNGVHAHKNKKHQCFDQTTKLAGPHCDSCDVTFLSQEAHDTHLRVSAKHLKDEHDPMRIRNEVYTKRSNIVGDGRKGRGPRAEYEPSTHINCEQCGVALRNFIAYSRHFDREHPGLGRTYYPAMKYPTMCEICGKIFQNSILLENHKWIHTGKKQFHCEQCNKSFTQKGTLIQHMLRHTGDKSANKCPQCGRCFTYNCNLKRHMLLHTGVKPYKCDLCEKCFVTSDQRKMHVQHFHLNKPWPKKKKKNKEEFVEN